MSDELNVRERRRSLSLVPGILAAILIPAATLTVLYFTPEQAELKSGMPGIATYYGLGWHSERGFTGKNWNTYRQDEEDGCWWEIDIREYGYSPARGYYPTGTLMEVSECLVEKNGNEPYPDRHEVRNGRYFDPEGHLVSEIREGTGRQTLFYADGTLRFQMDLKDGKRTDFKEYFPSGHVIFCYCYDSQEKPHGPCQSNYQDGTKLSRCRYEHGECVGLWYDFHTDGSIHTITDYTASPPASLQFAPGERQITAEELAAVEQP